MAEDGAGARHRGNGGGTGDGAGAAVSPIVEHPALGTAADAIGEAVAVAETRLPDVDKLAIVFQLAAVLAHAQLRQCTVRDVHEPARALRRATVDGSNRLCGLELSADRHGRRTQTVLSGWLRELFGVDGAIAGRGSARRAARRLLALWEDDLVEQRAELQVERILRHAPFLWSGRHGAHREALAARHLRPDGSCFLWVAGLPAFRERLLRSHADLDGLRRHLRSDDVATLWRGRPRDTPSKVGWSPRQLVQAGHWSAALSRWRREPPCTPVERLAHAECLYALGRFEDALTEAREEDSTQWRFLRMRASLQLGRLRPATRELGRIDPGRLPPERRVELIGHAIRLRGMVRDWEGVRDWGQRAVRIRGRHAALARVCAAEAAFDLDRQDEVERHLRRAAALDEGIVEHWRYLKIVALLFGHRGRTRSARAAVETALAGGRRGLPVHEAGRLWNELVLARVLDGDLAGAERACRHSLRLLSRCQGPLRTGLGLFNLAEIRVRRGRLRGVERILERLRRETELSGNERVRPHDLALAGRLAMARGRLEQAEPLLRAALDELDGQRGGVWREDFELLLAMCLARLHRPAAAGRLLPRVGGAEEGARGAARDLPGGVLEPEEIVVLLERLGDVEGADAAARDLGWAGPEVAAGRRPVGADTWRRAVASIGGYRAARWVTDVTSAGARTPHRVRVEAVARLEEAGAMAMKRELAATLEDGWTGLSTYLADPSGEGALRRLFVGVGAPEVRVEVAVADGPAEVLLRGPGGARVVETEARGMRWIFHVRQVRESVRGAALAVAAVHPLPECEGRTTPTSSSLPADVIGRSRGLLEAYRALARLARSDMPVLILGETGTGKERAARAVHQASGRASHPFLPVNCAAMDENLALSDLFGHRRGAFTGADQDRRGVFESADGGTVFLDEVGDLSARAQGLLLRVLQEGEVRRLGENRARRVDVRVVAATHRDLEQAARRGGFREDLLYRLNTGTVLLPPLRARDGDAVLLAEHFVERFAPGTLLSADARAAIARFDWPGNVRQLMSHIQRACALAGDGALEVEHLGLPLAPEPLAGWHEWLEDLKRERLGAALAANGGNQAATARSLGLTRQALSYLVRQLGLLPERS